MIWQPKKRIVKTHHKFWKHLDELLALYLWELFAPEGYEGFKMEDAVEVSDDDVRPWDVAIGVGRYSELNDKNPDGTRKPHCVARLTAKHFNAMIQYPCIVALIDKVERMDEEGPSGDLPFGVMIAAVADNPNYGKW